MLHNYFIQKYLLRKLGELMNRYGSPQILSLLLLQN